MSDKTTEEEDPILGTKVAGRYAVYAKLGEGGMGAVYAARQEPLGRTVALKVLLRQLSDDPIAVQRFEKEALAISRLAHPNTVTIFDYGQTEQGLMYIAMEFLEGRTLRETIELESPLEPRRAARVLAQIVRALSEAHQRGVIHRDLKPDNIMLVPTAGEPDFVKVLDFGVAKLRATQGMDMKTLTQGDVIFGTPRYMSPEQVNGVMDDPRSDLYAVGAIAYEMLSGTALFTGDSAIKILMAHVQQAPRPFTQLQKPVNVPEPLENLVMKLLAKDPSDRFADADALLQDLDSLPGVGGGLKPPSGKTEGMKRPIITPGAGIPQVGTKVMGSNFAKTAEGQEPDAEGDGNTVGLPESTPEAKRTDTAETVQTIPPMSAAELKRETVGPEPSAEQIAAAKEKTSTVDLVVPGKKGKGLYVGLALAAVALIAAGLVFGVDWSTEAPKTQEAVAADPVDALLKVVTEPAGATIKIDGDVAGKSPLEARVSLGRSHQIQAELEGYIAAEKTQSVDGDVTAHLVLLQRSVDAGPAVGEVAQQKPPKRRRKDAGRVQAVARRPDAAVGIDKRKRVQVVVKKDLPPKVDPDPPKQDDPPVKFDKFDDFKPLE